MSSEKKFHTVCFSTNYATFSSISVMKQYFMTADCLDTNYLKDNHVEFKHKILFRNGTEMLVHNSYYEISSFSKVSQACSKAECFIIFFDLEYNESLIELNKILKYLKEADDNDKKIFLINIYTSENNIKSNLTEESVKNCFSNYSLSNYEMSTVNMDSSDELSKAIDKLTEVTIQEKLDAMNGKDMDNSKSGCLIM